MTAIRYNLGQIFCLQLLFCSPDSVSVAIVRLATLRPTENKREQVNRACIVGMCVCVKLLRPRRNKFAAMYRLRAALWTFSICEKPLASTNARQPKQQEKLKSDNGNGIHSGETYFPFGSLFVFVFRLALHSVLSL